MDADCIPVGSAESHTAMNRILSTLAKLVAGTGCLLGARHTWIKTINLSGVDAAGYLIFTFALLFIGWLLIAEGIGRWKSK